MATKCDVRHPSMTDVTCRSREAPAAHERHYGFVQGRVNPIEWDNPDYRKPREIVPGMTRNQRAEQAAKDKAELDAMAAQIDGSEGPSAEEIVVLGDFDFDGETYEPELDQVRLNAQLQAVWDVICDGRWHTLADMEGVLPQSASARLRDFRKAQFGGHVIERRRREPASSGIFEYRLVPRPAPVLDGLRNFD